MGCSPHGAHTGDAGGGENARGRSPIGWWNAIRGDAYPLDNFSRSVPAQGPLVCPDVELRSYRGSRVRFSPPARVSAHFLEPLGELEMVVAEVAHVHYGRAPRRIVHAGAFNCRRVRNNPTRLSEHALGNAIDVVGFDFSPLSPQDRAAAPPDLPRRLHGRFAVRVGPHWEGDGASAIEGRHARFLREVLARLRRRDAFRGMLGPAHPSHESHFHFDYAPFQHRVL